MNPDRLANPAAKNYYRTVREEYPGSNESGLEPIGTKVLVLTDSIDTKLSFNLEVTPDAAERMTMAITSGVIVAIGGAAFTDWPHSERTWPGKVPQIGDRVRISKYAGMVEDGVDNRRYRLCQDADIAGFEQISKVQLFAVPAKAAN